MVIKLFLIFLLSAFSLLSSLTTAKPIVKTVYAIDNMRDGKLTAETVKKGQDFILIRQNPSKLPSDALLLHSTNFNIYTAATLEDMQRPDAAKILWVGKMTADGVKVYTIKNLGYSDIKVQQGPHGMEVFLVTPSGSADRLSAIQLEAPKLRFNVNPNTPKEPKTAQQVSF